MAEPARAFYEPHETAARLYALGLTEAVLRDAVERGVLARSHCTDFDPPSYGGIEQWAKTVRGLRDNLTTQGWVKDDSSNFSRILSPDRTMAIIVSAGDSRTGIPGFPVPSTKYPRGPVTQRAVNTNRQLALWEETAEVASDEPVQTTWILLVFNRRNEVRIELSCPNDYNDYNRVNSWSERIILRPLTTETTISIPDHPDDPDAGQIDVPVERR